MPLTIQIPDDTICGRCSKPAAIVRRGVLYCGDNCAAHNDARSAVGQLSRLVDCGQGGSPQALAALDMLADTLRRLEPVFPDAACPKCWGHMQGGAPMPPAPDGSQAMGERCVMCGHTRSAPGRTD